MDFQEVLVFVRKLSRTSEYHHFQIKIEQSNRRPGRPNLILNKYCMRINEDFLDDLEQDDIASASVSVQDTCDDSAWPYVFRF